MTPWNARRTMRGLWSRQTDPQRGQLGAKPRPTSVCLLVEKSSIVTSRQTEP